MKTIFLKSNIILLLIFLISKCTSANELAIESMNKCEAGQYDEAIVFGKMAVEKEPELSYGWYWLAFSQYQKKMYEEALKSFSKVTELSQGIQALDSYKTIAYINYYFKEYDSCIKNCLDGIKLYDTHKNDPEFTKKELGSWLGDLYIYLGWCYFIKDNHEQAISAFLKVTAGYIHGGFDDLTKARAYYGKAECNMALKKYEDALNDLNIAIRRAEFDTVQVPIHSYIKRGWCNLYLGNYAEAYLDFEKCSEYLKSNNSANLIQAIRGKAYSNLGLGDKNTAVNLLKTLHNTDTAYYAGYEKYDLTCIYYITGEKDKIRDLLGGFGFIEAKVTDYNNHNIRGVLIKEITKDSQAQKCGLKSGDVIIEIDSAEIVNVETFKSKMSSMSPGITAQIKILSDGNFRNLALIIDSYESSILRDPVVISLLKHISLKK